MSPRHPVSSIRARFMQMWLGWLLGPDTRCFWKHRVSSGLLMEGDGFTEIGLELPVVQQIMRWDMAVLRESPLAQELFREGQLEGQREGQLELVLRLLTRRVGTLDESLMQRVRGLSSPELEQLAEALLDFSELSDLQVWLAN